MSPKELFQQNRDRRQAHQDFVDSPNVREALMVAFNEFCWSLPEGENPEQSAKLDSMREGARRYISTFLALGNPPKARASTKLSKLHNQDAHYSTRYARKDRSGHSSTAASGSSTQPGSATVGS